jgi:hypothetical protein
LKLILSLLYAQFELLESVSRSIAEQHFQIQPAQAKWSAHLHLAHLVRYQVAFIQRVELILNRDVPQIDRYKAEEDLDFEPWKALKREELLNSYKEH